ncbi:MAG: DedA family protein [Candidatus Lloydbacteria bacterium]|nr:DedA family protein [Candidatus Lloydbacteria bacterium]
MFSITLTQIVSILSQYGYAIVFPLSIFEGPIVAVLSGFLSSLGIFNPFIVYVIVLCGDFVGDTLFYSLGRFGQRPLAKYGPLFGVTQERIERAERYFLEKHTEAISLSKIVHGVGIVGLIVAGALKIPYGRFLLAAAPVTFIQYALFLLIGILFGHAYIQIGAYFDYFVSAITIVVLAVITLFFILRKKKNGN